MAGRKAAVAPLIESGREEKKRELIAPPTALNSDKSVPTRRARTREWRRGVALTDNLDPPVTAAALHELVVQIDAMHQRPWIHD